MCQDLKDTESKLERKPKHTKPRRKHEYEALRASIAVLETEAAHLSHLKKSFRVTLVAIKVSEQIVLNTAQKMHEISVSAKRAIICVNFSKEFGPVAQGIKIIMSLLLEALSPAGARGLAQKSTN